MLTAKSYYNSVNLAKKIMSFKLIITVVGVIKTVAVIQAATKLKPIA